jgi:hypothetical protein
MTDRLGAGRDAFARRAWAPMGPFVAEAPEEAQRAMEQQVVESWKPFVVNGKTLVDQPMVIASGRG